MRKFGALILAAVCMAAVLTGCGSKDAGTSEASETTSAAASASAKAIGADLAGKITYQDELSEMDIDTASMFINLSDVNVVDSAIYESSGATAEEIIVLECASSADASKAAGLFKTRVAEQKENFEDYVPEELNKLGKAVIATSGNFAVLSVSDDADTAKSIISDYLK